MYSYRRKFVFHAQIFSPKLKSPSKKLSFLARLVGLTTSRRLVVYQSHNNGPADINDQEQMYTRMCIQRCVHADAHTFMCMPIHTYVHVFCVFARAHLYVYKHLRRERYTAARYVDTHSIYTTLCTIHFLAKASRTHHRWVRVRQRSSRIVVIPTS